MFGHDKHDDDQQADDAVLKPANVPDEDDATEEPTTAPEPQDSEDAPKKDTTIPEYREDTPSDENQVSGGGDDNELLDIKREALQELSPLVDHLDQTPEEKFKTTMMMIQATDDKTLIPGAYAAAKNISDDKARAQALLDIINEINYFTQKKD